MGAPQYISISADEVNCLIYAYFRDSGFKHAAFSLLSEAKLDHSAHFQKHIRRGELVDLLSKALLYVEVETHLHTDALDTGCKNHFTLLGPHQCTAERRSPPESTPQTIQTSTPPTGVNGATSATTGSRHVAPVAAPAKDANGKRKASPQPPDETRSEKRIKVANTSTRATTATATASSAATTSTQTKASKKTTAATVPPTESDTTEAEPKSLMAKIKKPRMLKDDYMVHPAVHLLKGHKAEVFVCQWNPIFLDQLATGAKDANVTIWDVPQQKPANGKPPIIRDKLSTAKAADLTAVSWSHDGTLLATACFDSKLRVFTRMGDVYFESGQHKGAIYSVRFNKAGDRLLTASLDCAVGLWDVKKKSLITLIRAHQDCAIDVDWLNENYFVSGGMDKCIYVYNISGAVAGKFIGHGASINQLKCSPSGLRLASCSDDTTTRVWNIKEYAGVVDPMFKKKSEGPIILEGHKKPVSSIAWSQKPSDNGHELLATSSFDGRAILWDATSGVCLRTFNDHDKPIYGLAFSPDSRFMATGGGDGYLYIYEVKTGTKNTPVFSWYSGSVKSGVFEIDWQQKGNRSRLAIALERKDTCIVDASKIPGVH